MKQSFNFIKNMLGVTLLEILLVLAVAALVIIVSIRYYSSATASQQATAMYSMVSAITASADNLAATTGDYSASGVSTTTVGALMPNQSMNTPWNTAVTIGSVGQYTYTVTINSTPAAVCNLLRPKLTSDSHYKSVTPATCPTTGNTTMTYQYDSRG